MVLGPVGRRSGWSPAARLRRVKSACELVMSRSNRLNKRFERSDAIFCVLSPSALITAPGASLHTHSTCGTPAASANGGFTSGIEFVRDRPECAGTLRPGLRRDRREGGPAHRMELHQSHRRRRSRTRPSRSAGSDLRWIMRWQFEQSAAKSSSRYSTSASSSKLANGRR